MSSLSKKDLLSIHKLTREDVDRIFKRTKELKDKQKRGEPHELLPGRTLAMIFTKPSLRTRFSFEVAMTQLGGHAIFLKAPWKAPSEIATWLSDIHMAEPKEDIGRILSGYADAIMARVHEHETLEVLAENATIPVINGLSNDLHPCQTLADLYTILEKKGKLEGLKLAYIGDGGCNTAHSTIIGCAKVGIEATVACPSLGPLSKRGPYNPKKRYEDLAKKDAKESGIKRPRVVYDPFEAVKEADIIYTDVWVSMGMEAEAEERLSVFRPFQVNKKLVSHAKKDVIVMHCLPAHRGLEITNEVIEDEKHSVVFDEAENRLHVQKAILSLLMS